MLAIVLASLMVFSAKTLGEGVRLWKINSEGQARRTSGEMVPFIRLYLDRHLFRG